MVAVPDCYPRFGAALLGRFALAQADESLQVRANRRRDLPGVPFRGGTFLIRCVHPLSVTRFPMPALLHRSLGLLCSVAAFTPATAFAGDVLVIARGTVTQITGGTPSAPFDSIAVGDSAELSVEAFGMPDVNTPTFWTYETDPLRGGVTIGSAYLPNAAWGPGTINLQNEAIDGVTFGAPLAEPFITGFTTGLIDFNGQFLSSPDVSQLIGQTMTSAFPGAAIIAAIPNPAIIEIEITSISFEAGTAPRLGTNACSPEQNSTNRDGITYAHGSDVASDNDVTLATGALPPNAFGFFLCSETAGFTANPGGSTGNLCLGGAIGRFVGPGQIQNSGPHGTFQLAINLAQLPSPTGPVAAQAGDTWHFTSWYRDTDSAGAPTSNFTDRLDLTFL